MLTDSDGAGDAQRWRARYILLLTAIIVARLVLIVALPMDDRLPANASGDEPYYQQLASSLADSSTFTEGHLKAYRPPGYPALLSIALRLFGNWYLPVQIAQNVAFLVATLLLADAVRRRAGAREALFAFAGLNAAPQWLFLPQQLLSESLFVLLLAAGLRLVVEADLRSRWRWWFASGVCFGLAALTREIGLYIALLWAAYFAWRQRGATIARFVVLATGIVLVVAPWTIRNVRIFGHPVLITTNSLTNLYIGNNTAATGAFVWALPADVKPLWNQPGPDNEYRVYRRSGAAAVTYMLENPVATMKRWPTKLAILWGPILPARSGGAMQLLFAWYRLLVWLLILPLMVVALARRLQPSYAVPAVILFIVTTGIHLLTYAAPIYRSGIELFAAGLAGLACADLMRRLYPAAS